MHHSNLRVTVVLLSAAALLAACGGDGGGGGSNSSAGDVPASAQQSASGLIAFMKDLIGRTDETSEPIALGNAVLPTDDTAEPAAVN